VGQPADEPAHGHAARFAAGASLKGIDMTDCSPHAIEQEIQAKGLTAPRVTPADIEAAIVSAHYFNALEAKRIVVAGDARLPCGLPEHEVNPPVLGLLTFCVLVMRNGFTVVGKSACASPENFDAELGKKIARQDAISQCWALMGYELRSKLAERR
jgi:hypothetical protein